MQLSMLDGLDLYSLRCVLPSHADHVARSRPLTNRSDVPPKPVEADLQVRLPPSESYGRPSGSFPASRLDDVEKRCVGSQTDLVSDDAAFDARRTRSLQPPLRFTV